MTWRKERISAKERADRVVRAMKDAMRVGPHFFGRKEKRQGAQGVSPKERRRGERMDVPKVK